MKDIKATIPGSNKWQSKLISSSRYKQIGSENLKSTPTKEQWTQKAAFSDSRLDKQK